MLEVEAKVPVSKGQYQALMTRLKKEAKYLGFKKNQDIYYEKSKKTFIRVRDRNESYDFDLKLRQTNAGIESNMEMSWSLPEPDKWKALLKKLKFKAYQQKTKQSEYFSLKGFTVELNEVRPLGYFLEIEKVVSDPDKVKEAKKDLIRLFKDMGFSQEQFESRPYLELLANV